MSKKGSTVPKSTAPKATGKKPSSATRGAEARTRLDVPAPFTAAAIVFRFQTARLLRGRKLRLSLIAAALVVVASVTSRYAFGTDGADTLEDAYTWGFFRLLFLMVPFLMAADQIGEEVEARTLAYLTLRPIGRGSLLLGKYLAAVVTSASVLLGAILLVHLGVLITDGSLLIDELGPTLALCGIALLLTAAYGAICMLWGALVPEAATIVSAVHLALLEFLLSMSPGFLRWGSMSYLGQQIVSLPKAGLLADTAPDVPTWIGLVVILVLTLLFLGLAVATIRVSEYRPGKA